jgi:uncharacterized protein YciI
MGGRVPFAIYCVDKPDSSAVRMKARPDHLAYLVGFEDKIIFAGPLLTDDQQTMIGSLLVLDLPDRAAAEKFAANDPYRKAGLFQSVNITGWRKAYPKS